MKRGRLVFIVLSLFALVTIISFASAASPQTISISPSSGQVSVYQNYTITIGNPDLNITQVNLTAPLGASVANPINTSTNASLIPVAPSTLQFTNNSVSLIASGATGLFWFNATANQSGTFNVNVSFLDNNSHLNYTILTVSISAPADSTPPTASFVDPTPADDSVLDYDFIPVNVTASDSGSGLKNITIYLYNSISLIDFHVGTSSPYFYNFTSLDDDTYYINATAFDNAGNNVSISTRTITISTGSTCTSNWTCDWSTCVNNTQTKINCVDSNSCSGATAPTGTQACNSCTTNWNCTAWAPVACASGSNQTRICNDLNSCAESTTESRKCVITSASNANASGNSIFSSSTLFWVVLGIIILSIAGVAFALIRMKKKSASSNSGDESGYRTYTPRGPPPSSFPPPGYSNPPRAYPNQPQSY